jgi:hypothetical protein
MFAITWGVSVVVFALIIVLWVAFYMYTIFVGQKRAAYILETYTSDVIGQTLSYLLEENRVDRLFFCQENEIDLTVLPLYLRGTHEFSVRTLGRVVQFFDREYGQDAFETAIHSFAHGSSASE